MRRKSDAVLLLLAGGSFGFDLFHFGHHLVHDPALLGLPGVLPKLVWKAVLFMVSLGLWACSFRSLAFVMGLSFVLSAGNPSAFARTDRQGCERAREFMNESGIARDAREDFLGRLKIQPPRSSFPPEMDKITWWGTFKPFEFWENPRFEAVWINPRGEAVERQSFQAGQCQLAKTTLSVTRLPRGRLEPGMWRVVVNCQDVVIDHHPFQVMGSPALSPEGGTSPDSVVMIWADGVNQ